ncbi:MAG: lipoprotein-releasing ABC transporter permease subunit [Rhodobacteraceae bacterium]|nr:lipoprotein-releasing ABC transporter permease subunit [Paracoccaceae bacterium]
MAGYTAPFSAFEWMIAWRYLRAKRSEGGVSIMTWISLIGITLAVFALIAVMAVRAGFREEFVGTILGVDAHVTVYSTTRLDENRREIKGFPDTDPIAERLLQIPGVVTAAPLIRGQVMTTFRDTSRVGDVYGISRADLEAIPRVGLGADAYGDIARFDEGVAMGSVLARNLGVTVGDKVRLTNPNGARTPMGMSPRTNAYEVVYIFTAGRYAVDETRVYMPLAEAQPYFNREGFVDEFAVTVADPEQIDSFALPMMQAVPDGLLWTWRDAAGSFLRALTIEDNMMFIIMSILVLIASLNIISGLIMLVKNKGADIGILRTMGLTEGSILRIFFICGASTGLVGTALGVILGCLFAIYIDPIFAMVNAVAGGDVWDPSVRSISFLPAKLQFWDVASAVGLSLGLSFLVTLIPARRAARMNPVEALRYA